MITIEPYEHIDGVRFGESSSVVIARLGQPASRRTNREGEEELCYSDTIWRFRDDRLVECTISMKTPVRVQDQVVTSLRTWLSTVDRDAVTAYGFLVSQALGIAVDLDDESCEYVSVFEKGRWDVLLKPTRRKSA